MQKKRVLFIEDESELLDLMKIRLEANGYEMESALDGEEGLEKARSLMPELVLLDIQLPRLNGLKVCKSIKSDPATKKIPVIIISASIVKDLWPRSKKAGADDVISKPFDADELLMKIKKHII
jgi:DNA-binding response OmpR family regulator